MKKIFLISSVILFVFMTAFVFNGNSVSKDNSNTPFPTFQVTVYQTSSTTPQANAEVVVYDSNQNIMESGTTDNYGKVTWSWNHSYGTYTVKAWYLARPNDSQNGQTTVSYSGASIYTSVTLGPNY